MAPGDVYKRLFGVPLACVLGERLVGRTHSKSRLGRDLGFTLVEVSITLAIVGMLTLILTAVISLALVQTPKITAIQSIENQQQLARYWLIRDANSASVYTPGSGTTYGTFTWTDYTSLTGVTYSVAYTYDSAIKALIRTETIGGVAQQGTQVAAEIQNQSDVVFTWNQAQQKITVNVTPTILEAKAVGDISRTSTLVAFLRYSPELAVFPPSAAGVPTPLPGSAFYNVAANPTVLTGTYVSGNAASLSSIDSTFYVVSSSSGNPKEATFEVYSQTITSPTTINNIQIIWAGKASANNVSINFYFKATSGASYSSSVDAGFQITSLNTTTTFSMFLSESQVSAVNASRVVYLKVNAQGNAAYNLSTDQIQFVASP